MPDCVALGIEADGASQPLILADLNKLTIVLMPLEANKVLIGYREGLKHVNVEEFNKAAAVCSHSYFVSARNDPDLVVLAETIGDRSSNVVDDAISEAFKEFMKGEQLFPSSPNAIPRDEMAESRVTTQADVIADVEQDELPLPQALSYQVNFLGCADQETAEKIAATLKIISSELSRLMSLDRLDEVTFAADYAGALRDLDRGFAANMPLTPTNEDYGVGVAMTAMVVREGIVKCHVVVQGGIGHALIGQDESTQRFALHTLVHQLAHAACVQLLDESLARHSAESALKTILMLFSIPMSMQHGAATLLPVQAPSLIPASAKAIGICWLLSSSAPI